MKKQRSRRTPRKKASSPEVLIRRARVRDIPELLAVEEASFDYDQLSRRNFHWMIKNAHSLFLVLESESKIIGYGLVLMNKGTSLARLYSLAILKDFQGLGLASRLLLELEERLSQDEDCAYLRLEVKEDNRGAIKLYEKLGYTKFTEKENYYDDGKKAYCYEKRIRTLTTPQRLNIPYYSQSTDFTCGPACLMMAIKALNPAFVLGPANELQIWREATTVFMTSGHGGCGPHGLALSAWRRGHRVEMYLSKNEVLFLNTVRSQEKKKVMEFVHRDFEKRLHETNIKVMKKKLTLKDLKEILQRGGIPIVLITTYHFDHNRVPHWVVVTAYDDHFVYIHDPDNDQGPHDAGVMSRLHIPIPEDQFVKISRWGKDRLCAAVIVYSD